jgi:hypothetical protein
VQQFVARPHRRTLWSLVLEMGIAVNVNTRRGTIPMGYSCSYILINYTSHD